MTGAISDLMACRTASMTAWSRGRVDWDMVHPTGRRDVVTDLVALSPGAGASPRPGAPK